MKQIWIFFLRNLNFNYQYFAIYLKCILRKIPKVPLSQLPISIFNTWTILLLAKFQKILLIKLLLSMLPHWWIKKILIQTNSSKIWKSKLIWINIKTLIHRTQAQARYRMLLLREGMDQLDLAKEVIVIQQAKITIKEALIMDLWVKSHKCWRIVKTSRY